jgi:hypothetical protein
MTAGLELTGTSAPAAKLTKPQMTDSQKPHVNILRMEGASRFNVVPPVYPWIASCGP